jgi:bifunctional non-homologous end joining protein LigD
MPPKKQTAKAPQKKAAAPLERYLGKRNFGKTPEPRATPGLHANGWIFVIQEHHARSHHFDLRLEIDGLLASWAVPKGVPDRKNVNRLAVQVEDHPLEYAGFEGEIPKGNYGAGKVKIVDKGVWSPLDSSWRKSFEKGRLKFTLKGEKHRGEYLLVRKGDGPDWLFRKLGDEALLVSQDEGMTESAGYVSPQLASPASSVPKGMEWIHELKLDGYRVVAVKREGKIRLFTRNGMDWTERFPSMSNLLSEVSDKDFVLDGEVVVYDEKGRSSFGALQEALAAGKEGSMHYVAFDLLNFDGRSLRKLPLTQRLDRLAEIMGEDPARVFRSKVWPSPMGGPLFKQACENGLEGIISKRANAAYHEGSRRDWVKTKCVARQEFIICGYTLPKEGLRGFGALLLGSFEKGKLVSRGKVGTGFSDRQRVDLIGKLESYQTKIPPFGIHDKRVQWLLPSLVAEVAFSEFTREGAIRHGRFVGLREDKEPSEVHAETVQSQTLNKALEVCGIPISHPERLVFPEEGISKLEVIRYYEKVASLMLPFVAERPLAILRAPEGISGNMFFQKSIRNHEMNSVYEHDNEQGEGLFFVKNVRGIVSLAQHGAIEFHPWGSKLVNIDQPDSLIWDLDPDVEVPWEEVLGAVLLIRDYLSNLNLETVVKTSGGKGLHVMTRIKRHYEWSVMKLFTKCVAQNVAALNPRRFITVASKSRRRGKILIDWMRNGRGATCIAPWSLRARAGARISRPVDWRDLRNLLPEGFSIREPCEEPMDWKSLKTSIVTKTSLRQVGMQI